MSSDELHRIALDREKAIRDQIDDYRDTIFAILGFCSLWFFDAKTRQNRQTVRIFQGRHLSPIPAHVIQQDQEVCIADVCPDLGIVIEGETGILGEVKKNFPKDSDERKQSVFTQLKSYDQEFVGWPTQDGKLKRHEIVLLVHQTTSRSACDFWRTDVDHKIKFDRTFAIFQFNRSDQRVPYFFFQLVEGNINQVFDGVDQRDGVQVPMEALLGLYSRSQIYDAEPPLPYLLHLIWEHVCSA